MEETEKQAEKQEKPTLEVIAQKARGYLGAVIFTLLFGIFMAFFGALLLVLAIVSKGPLMMYIFAVVMFLGGIGLSIYSGATVSKIRRIPQFIIIREGDALTFNITKTQGFTCKIAEVTNVSFFQAYGRGQTRPWGTLVVYFGERELTLVYIKDVVATHNRLFSLMIENKKTEQEKTEETGENDG